MSGQPNVGGEGSETEGCRPRSLRGKSGISSRRALVGNDLDGFLVPFRNTVLLGHGSCLFGVQADKTTESRHQAGLFRALSVPVHGVCTDGPAAISPTRLYRQKHCHPPPSKRAPWKEVWVLRLHGAPGTLGGWHEMQILGCWAQEL